jgi:hypothetical protein
MYKGEIIIGMTDIGGNNFTGMTLEMTKGL